METLGDYIRQQRSDRGWTQQELADRSGVKRAYLSRIETGDNKLPGADTRRRLAAVFGVSHEAILIAAGELLPEEASRPTEPRRYAPDSGHAAVLAVLETMSEIEARALAETGKLFLSLRRQQGAAHREPERVPALR